MNTGFSVRARIRRSAWFILFGAYCATFAAGVYGVTLPVSAGAEIARSGSTLTVTDISPGSTAWYSDFHVGDTVVEVNGESAETWTDDGESITSLVVQEASSGILKTAHGETSLIDETIALNGLGVVFVLTSVLMFFRARQTSEIASFAFLAIAAGIAFAVGPASVAGHHWARHVQGMSVFSASAYFAAFFLVFGRSQTERGQRFSSWAPEAGLVISAIAAIPWVLTLTDIVDLFALMRSAAFGALGLSLLGGLASVAWRYRVTDADTKEKIRIAAVGTALGLTPFLWLSVIPQALGLSSIVTTETTAIGLALIPLSFGYAVLRHQLMGIRSLVHRGTAYALITAGLIVALGSVLMAANLLLPDLESSAGFEITILALLLVAVPFVATVRRRAFALVDRILYQGALEPQEIIRTLNVLANSEDDLTRLLQRAINLIGEGLDAEFAWFMHGTPQPGAPLAISYRQADLATQAEAKQAVALVESGVQQTFLPESEQTVIIGTVHGVGGNRISLVIGPLRSEEPFGDGDIQLAQTICGTLTASVARIQLLAEVRARTSELQTMGTQIEHIQEEERQEISSYLHDEPLQKVAYALAQMRERSLPEDLASLLEDVARDLRSTAASLSPNVLRDSGLVTAVQWLVSEQKRRNEFSVFLEFEGLTETVRFTDAIELSAYRVIQEALNNCRKHSKARAVWVRVEYAPGSLNVSVEDNGVGFAATAKGERRPDEGLGIRALKQRVASLGGSLSLSERASRGAAVKASFPVADEAAKAAI